MYVYYMYKLKYCHECYMESMAWKRVEERQIRHEAKPSAILYLETTP